MIIKLCRVCGLQIKPTPVTNRDRIWCRCPSNAKSVNEDVMENTASIIDPENLSEQANEPKNTINGEIQSPDLT